MKKLLLVAPLLVPAVAIADDANVPEESIQVSQYYSDSFSSEPFYGSDTIDADSFSAPRTQNSGAGSFLGQNWDVTLGLTVLNSPEYVGSGKNETRVFPMISAKYHLSNKNHAYISPYGSIGYEHAYSDKLQTGIATGWRQERDNDDAAILAGTSNIGTAIEVGPYIVYKPAETLTLRGDMMVDVSNQHNGMAAKFSANYAVPVANERVHANLMLSTLYGDKDFMETYFGVSQTEATAGRPAYDPDSGFRDVTYGGNISYNFTNNAFVRLDARVRELIGDAKDSPLMDESTNFISALSVGYNF